LSQVNGEGSRFVAGLMGGQGTRSRSPVALEAEFDSHSAANVCNSHALDFLKIEHDQTSEDDFLGEGLSGTKTQNRKKLPLP